MKTRIAILASAFDPRLNYQESVTARTLHRSGYDVRVFTTTAPIVRKDISYPEVDAASGIAITRTSKFIRIKNTFIPRDPDTVAAIRAFNPDRAILFAPASGIGYHWMSALPASCKVMAFISDLPWHRTSSLMWWLLKRRWLRAVFKRADAVAAVTADTEAMLRSAGGKLLDGKLLMTGLSYDNAIFGDQPAATPPEVLALKARAPRLIAIVTKSAPDKQLDEAITAITSVMAQNPDTGFILAGITDDACGLALRNQIAASPVADRCLALPVLEAPAIKGIFENASCALFSLVSIGIQQALACGCPVILRSGQPASHILKEGTNSSRFDSFSSLPATLLPFLNHPWNRQSIRDSILPWRSEVVLDRLMSFADSPLSQRIAAESSSSPS